MAVCESPIYIELSHFKYDRDSGQYVTAVPVQCGKCPLCIKRKVQQWCFRIMQEYKRANNGYFITLTYDTRHVPITPNGFMTLRKDDVQRWLKRLRKEHLKNQKKGIKLRSLQGIEDQPIKYYLVGEYGDLRKRPHYHAIIFNVAPQEIERTWWQKEPDDKLDDPYDPNRDTPYTQMGLVDIQPVNERTVAYTLKYMQKGNGSLPYKFAAYDGIPQFSLSSKGLGENYLTEQIIRYHREDYDRNYLTTEMGYRVAMPKYYKEKIWKTEKEREEMLMHIVKRMRKLRKDEKKDFERKKKPYTFEQNKDNERTARAHRFKRLLGRRIFD